MKDVYLKAAQIVDRARHGYASCIAIDESNKFSHEYDMFSADAKNYSRLFSPRVASKQSDTWGYWWSEDWEERNNCRVLALLFMHWISQGDK